MIFRRVGDRLLRGKAAIDQHVVRILAAPLLHLVEHRRQFFAVATRIGHLDAHNQAAVGVGHELRVVTGTVSAVGEFHVAGLGIGRGGAGLFGRLARDFRPLFPLQLQLGAVLQRRFNPLLTFPRRTLAGRSLAAMQFVGVLAGELLQRFHLLLGFGQTTLERGLAAERRLAGAGPYPHPVLRHASQPDQAFRHQAGQQLRQQAVPFLAALRTKIGERFMTQLHPAAQPLIVDVPLA